MVLVVVVLMVGWLFFHVGRPSQDECRCLAGVNLASLSFDASWNGDGRTDDRGVYRLYDLAAGDYIIQATPRVDGMGGSGGQLTSTIGASSLPLSSGLDSKSHFAGLSALSVPKSISACTFDFMTPTKPALTSFASTSAMSHK